MPQFFAFCPCVDTGCPKITRRIGTHNTKEEAVEAVCKHIMSSSYHYTEYPMAMKLACETMIEMDEEYGPIRHTSIRDTLSQCPRPSAKSGASEPYASGTMVPRIPSLPAFAFPMDVEMMQTFVNGLQAAEDAINTSRQVSEEAARTFKEQAAVVKDIRVGVKSMLEKDDGQSSPMKKKKA